MSGKTRQYLKNILKGALALGVGAAVVAGALSGANTNAMAAEGDTDRDSGIVVNLHDYNEGDINSGSHRIGFGDSRGSGWQNTWTELNGGAAQGIVAKNLNEDGYPELSDELGGESLGYLFSSESDGKDYLNASGLLIRDEVTGYWEYDSSKNFAYISDTEANSTTITRLDHPRYEATGDSAVSPGVAQFLPFNELSNDTESFDQDYHGGHYAYSGYRLQNNDATGVNIGDSEHENDGYVDATGNDYLFGMDITTNFLMPKGGVVNGQDMVFEFDGDDDVWVFIDDVLVLDIGGIHDSTGGDINFATGQVHTDKVVTDRDNPKNNWESEDETLYGLYSEALQNKGLNESEISKRLEETFTQDENGNHVFKDYSTHTLKFFYLERGKGGSNCHIKFNLPTIPRGVVEVGKEVTNTNTADFVNAEFTMKVETADDKSGRYVPYSGPYALFDLDGDPIRDESGKQITGTTQDGTFTLKHGQVARLTGQVQHEGDEAPHDILETTYYRVTETGAYGYSDNYEFELDNVELVDESDTSVTGEIGKSVPLRVAEHQHLVVRNSFIEKNKYSVAITKQMADGQAAPEGEKFSVKITDVNDNVVTGVQYRINSGDSQTISDNGIIQIASGDTITLLDVAYGAEFKIREVGLDSEIYNSPTYSVSEGDGSVASDGSYAIAEVELENEGDTDTSPEVTITNTLVEPPLGDPEHNKRIGMNDDGTYTLALDVLGDTSSRPVTSVAKPLDIVLVLDDSGSMDDPMGEDKYAYEPIDASEVVVSRGGTEDGPMGSTHYYQITNGGEYYADINGEYIRINEITESHSGGFWSSGSYNEHVRWELNGNTVTPETTQFYNRVTIDAPSRTEALKSAVEVFIDQAEEANARIGDQSDKIRISIVVFADGSDVQSELVVCEGGNAASLKESLDSLTGDGATNAEEGMKDANSVLAKSGRDDASQLVIFFTDGVPTDFSTFSDDVANGAVENASAIKGRGGIVYTVGIFDGADPDQTNVEYEWGQPVESSQANVFMNAVSSNYPNSTAWNELGSRAEGDPEYYKTADTAGGLNSVFQDIFHTETQTNGYENVAITDTLSKYAEMVDEDAIIYDEEASKSINGNLYYKVTDSGAANNIVVVTGQDGSQTELDSSAYELYWSPSVKSLRVEFKNMLEKDVLYTLKFNVKPTEEAYKLFDENKSYPDTGNADTDLYETVTSSGKPGFYSNDSATVEWNGESDEYPKPVLQADSLTINGVLDITKTMNGHALDAEMFDFTVTPLEGKYVNPVTGVTSTISVDDVAAKAGITLDDGVYTFYNASSANEGDKQEIRTGATIRFTREDVGKTYAYEYAEVTTGLHQGYDTVSPEQIVFDQSKYKIELAVSEVVNADYTRTLKVTMSKYVWDAGENTWSSIEGVDPVEITPANCDCSNKDPLMTIDFVNEMNPYLGLQIVKIDKATSEAANPTRLQGARFELKDSKGKLVQAYKSPDFTNDENKVNGEDAVTDADGILYFYGLEEGETYTLTETKFPSGYQAETEEGVSFTFMVDDGVVKYQDGDGMWVPLESATESGDPDGDPSTKIEGCFYTQVANVKIPDLPSSGSSGAILVMSSGVAAIALGGAYLARRRMNPEA